MEKELKRQLGVSAFAGKVPRLSKSSGEESQVSPQSDNPDPNRLVNA